MKRRWPLTVLLVLVAAVFAGGFLPGTAATVGPPWSPAGAGLLGTDVLGRDVLSRTLAGGAGLLALALPSGVLTTALGTLAGLAAASSAAGERLLALLSGAVFMVPALLLVLVGAVVLPYWAAVPAVVLLLGVPMSARVVHATARPLRRAGFVEAAVAHGESPPRELLPAVTGTVLADLGLRIGTALQLAVAVTVLGFGPPPPAADWASMLRENLPGADLNPWSVLAPAGALAALAVAVTLGLDLAGRRRTRKPDVVHNGLSTKDGLVLEGTWRGGDRELHLDVRVGDGTVLGVTGASGAGKTSLLRLLLGDLPPATTSWHGSLVHRGTAIRPGTARARRWRRRHVGFLGQDPALDPLRRIGSSVADGLRRRDSRAVRELLDRMGLPDGVARRYPHQISGGEAQRVALARALAGDPELLVLDEPTSALDGETLERVTAALAGRTAVVVSHDRAWLARVAGEVLDLGQEPAPVERLVVRVGEPVFRGGGLELHEGELVVLLGKSGAGKTTLLRTLARTGLIRGEGWGRPRPGEVELLPQDAYGALNPARTLADAVGRPLRVLHGIRRPRAEAVRLLAETGLGPEFAGRRPDECSGGQRQRAGLARALAARPRVLLADEPTSALDAATAGAVLDALDRRRVRGLAVLLVTHDERLAARADRVLKLGEGQLR
ncbi:ATP-binding cassette domain-containing protein [Amycolatopsis sp. MtRt-6]|uniref:ATP-binding cassette domain-containing protein n=1 Tax=Amycolatopsis sp. MtRt-6 TaxID=2792782 RepID=UPI001A8E6FB1|nr:ATP-binding cassette domain-containing protein [Amycolatopsis sp. MtRt-6]